MHTKILGGSGGGNMPNTGSCGGLADYMEHDRNDYISISLDSENLQELQQAVSRGDVIVEEYFFDQTRDDITRDEVVKAIDSNHSKLKKTDEKFYHIINSPSEEEIRQIPGGDSEKIKAYKTFIREDLMVGYAENAKRGIAKEDILYFSKVHTFRKKDTGDLLGMHCHTIVSRKTRDGTRQLSPLSNHRDSRRGAVRGGFDRTEFYTRIERDFDRRFGYPRKYSESFEYFNMLKNGTAEQRAGAQARAALEQDPMPETVQNHKNVPEDTPEKQMEKERAHEQQGEQRPFGFKR